MNMSLLTFWQTATVWKQGQVKSISPPAPECWNQTYGLAHWSPVGESLCQPRRHPQQCGGSRRSHSHCGEMWQTSEEREEFITWKLAFSETGVERCLYSLEFRFPSLTCVLPTNEPNEVVDTGIGNCHYCHWMYLLLSHLHWEVDVYLFCSCCANVALKGEEIVSTSCTEKW